MCIAHGDDNGGNKTREVHSVSECADGSYASFMYFSHIYVPDLHEDDTRSFLKDHQDRI